MDGKYVEAVGDGAPRGAPDGDVIHKAIEGKELDEEEQRRLQTMFQEMERRDRPWPTTGEHCFRITMAGFWRESSRRPLGPQPEEEPVLVDPIVMPQNSNSGASQPIAAIDEETPHEEPIQHEQNDSDASQLASTTSIEEFDLVNSIAEYYEAAMEYESDV